MRDRSEFGQMRWLPFRNTSIAADAWSVVSFSNPFGEIGFSGNTAQGIFPAHTPDSSQTDCLVCPEAARPSQSSRMTCDWPAMALVDAGVQCGAIVGLCGGDGVLRFGAYDFQVVSHPQFAGTRTIPSFPQPTTVTYFKALVIPVELFGGLKYCVTNVEIPPATRIPRPATEHLLTSSGWVPTRDLLAVRNYHDYKIPPDTFCTVSLDGTGFINPNVHPKEQWYIIQADL